MKLFLYGHATHPDWRVALSLVVAQIEAQRGASNANFHATKPTLGWLYLSDRYAAEAGHVLASVRSTWSDVDWTGAVGIGVSASGIEYFDEPALVVMLAEMPREQFRVFSGAQPLPGPGTGFEAATAQVHADPSADDLSDLIEEMAGRTSTGYLFGGLASARTRTLTIANGIFEGGLSGVGYSRDVALISRVTQGCQPVGPVRQITAGEGNLVTRLNGEPALDCLLRDLGIEHTEPREALPRLRQILVGLSNAGEDLLSRPGQFGTDTLVRHLIGLDPGRRGIAIGDHAVVGQQLAFCSRDTAAARRDLVRICSEIREELEPETLMQETAAGAAAELSVIEPRMAGAIYVSCTGRGGPHFGAPSAELAIVRHALGDVPLVGFFAAGEIARHHLYGYTGVLTVFPA